MTTGNLGGFDAWLEDGHAGTLTLETQAVKCSVPLEDIGFEEQTFEAGALGRQLRIFRLPETNQHLDFRLERRIGIAASRDNPIYVRVTQEDGNLICSSPIYFFR